MEVYDIGLIRLAVPSTTSITTMMKFSKKKVLKCLWVMREVGIGLLRPATLTFVIAEVMYIGLLIPATLPLVIVKDIMLVMLVEVDLGYERPDTLPLEIGQHYFMLKQEVDICISPATIHPITQVTVVNF